MINHQRAIKGSPTKAKPAGSSSPGRFKNVSKFHFQEYATGIFAVPFTPLGPRRDYLIRTIFLVSKYPRPEPVEGLASML